jgi:hypothetical protein
MIKEDLDPSVSQVQKCPFFVASAVRLCNKKKRKYNIKRGGGQG